MIKLKPVLWLPLMYIMKLLRLCMPLWLLIAVYSLASFFWGDHGYFAMKDLENISRRLNVNVEELGQEQHSLLLAIDAVQSEDWQSVEARNLGFVAEGERIIQVLGRSPRRLALSAGTYIDWEKPKGIEDLLLKKYSLLMALFLSSLIWGLRYLILKKQSKVELNGLSCGGGGFSNARHQGR